MPRTVKDARLESRTARLRLAAQHEPYWRSIDGGMHIGYRKGINRGTFIARYRKPDGRYVKKALGLADDTQEPDGDQILSFSQAQAQARDWFGARALELRGGAARPRTVKHEAANYMVWFAAHRKSKETTQTVIDAFINPALGDVALSELTADIVERWHLALAEAPRRKRRKKGAASSTQPPPRSEEDIRRRRATANRVLTVLKAILSRAYDRRRIADTHAWRSVKPFREVDVARVRYLSVAETKALIAACPVDLQNLVRAAVLTGCRYGELAQLRCGDVKLPSNCVLVARSKSGRKREVSLTDEAVQLFKGLIEGKNQDDLVLVRSSGAAWGKSHHFRLMRQACKRARIIPPVSVHVLRHTHASLLAGAGAPLNVITQQLGHADVRMTHKHYAHLSPGYVSETVRRALPRFGRPARTRRATEQRPPKKS